MIAPAAYSPLTRIKQFKIAPRSNSNDLNRVFAAAVVSRHFRDLLLQNPREALTQGYRGETFSLSPEENDLIASIRAETLSDLAKQVYSSISAGD